MKKDKKMISVSIIEEFELILRNEMIKNEKRRENVEYFMGAYDTSERLMGTFYLLIEKKGLMFCPYCENLVTINKERVCSECKVTKKTELEKLDELFDLLGGEPK